MLQGVKMELFTVSEEEKDNPYAIVDHILLKQTITNQIAVVKVTRDTGIDFYEKPVVYTRYLFQKR